MMCESENPERKRAENPWAHTYACIDLKSYYASVECVHRQLDPLTANLLVADESRSDQTICLAVSPSLKSIGVPSRPRLFEARQAIERYEREHRVKVNYLIAMPRMAEYERISALIYSIYLRFVAPEDIHVYSIDECFFDCTGYLHAYAQEARRQHIDPARIMIMRMIRAVLRETGITATAGIGTNLYLAKVAMDMVAKKTTPDKDGVRIAQLTEESYRYLLWEHRPLTDFWMIGPGRARRLNNAYMFTMGDVAARSQYDEEWFYRSFGVDGEIVIDHAWGIEPVTMQDIKQYHPDSHSLSNGQVLPRPYKYPEARLVMNEMVEALCTDMFTKNIVSDRFTWWVSYDYRSLEECPLYDGPLSVDFYGRLHPRHNSGTIRLASATNVISVAASRILPQFDQKTDHRLLYRRLGVNACDIRAENFYQMDLFTDYEALERERRIQRAMLEIRRKFGANAVFKGLNLLEGATALERNCQIGGHRK